MLPQAWEHNDKLQRYSVPALAPYRGGGRGQETQT